MALSDDESALLLGLANNLQASLVSDLRLDSYFEGAQRLQHIGLAVPPELRRFETVVNWPRIVVEAIEERCDAKSFLLPGQDISNEGLQEAWDVNDLDSEWHLTATDSLVLGRGFISVGSNEADPSHPLISVESPHEMTASYDARTRRVTCALKLYGPPPPPSANGSITVSPPTLATLYTPYATIWLELYDAEWVEVDRDDHGLGRVPVVPFLNRRRTARWDGVSEIQDAIGLTDAAARSLTNLQIAGETHSVPQKWVLGMTKGDFVDADGEPIPAWQSYFSAIWANQNKDAKVGQFDASNLSNFHETVNHYGQLIAGLYGLPMRYLGQNTANPPSADGIRADEARLVKRAERKMSNWGNQIGRVMALYLRFRDGQWLDQADRIRVEWHDAGTPTYAARVDGIQKLTGGKPILSMQGGWDELGWSDARKKREQDYMDSEAIDPVLERMLRPIAATGAPAGG